MISVNLFADLFDWDTKTAERSERVYGVSRSLYTYARVGKAGASPLIFIEAAIALMDALGAYADYRQAESKTRELQAQGRALAEMMKELKKQFHHDTQVRNARTESQFSSIRESLVRSNTKQHLGITQINNLASQIKKLGEHIAAQRLDAPLHCPPLLQLERTYYRLVDAQLELTLNVIDE